MFFFPLVPFLSFPTFCMAPGTAWIPFPCFFYVDLGAQLPSRLRSLLFLWLTSSRADSLALPPFPTETPAEKAFGRASCLLPVIQSSLSLLPCSPLSCYLDFSLTRPSMTQVTTSCFSLPFIFLRESFFRFGAASRGRVLFRDRHDSISLLPLSHFFPLFPTFLFFSFLRLFPPFPFTVLVFFSYPLSFFLSLFLSSLFPSDSHIVSVAALFLPSNLPPPFPDGGFPSFFQLKTRPVSSLRVFSPFSPRSISCLAFSLKSPVASRFPAFLPILPPCCPHS